MILEELEIPYKFERWELEDVKKEPFTKLNPNGRYVLLRHYFRQRLIETIA